MNFTRKEITFINFIFISECKGEQSHHKLFMTENI